MADTSIAWTRHLDVYTSELHCRISEVSVPSPAMKVIRSITRRSALGECSLFPITVIYSFRQTDLCLALSFFPASESKTHIRYDLFAHSAVNEPDIQKMSEILQSATKNLIAEIELEYQSISTKQRWVLLHLCYIRDLTDDPLTRSSELNCTGMAIKHQGLFSIAFSIA
jgi:hypothetical protein